MNAWQDDICQEINISKVFDANINFPKIHLMFHWPEQIRQYGALQQYSATRHDQAHKTNLNNGWNASNHNLNYLRPVITI
jgi:hypothetical protein